MPFEEFQGPPIHTTLRLEGIHLHNLPRLLYGNTGLTVEQAKQVWDELVANSATGRDPHKVLRGIIPNLPLIKSSLNPLAAVVQFLAALEWSIPGKFQIIARHAAFKSSDVNFSLRDYVLKENGKLKRIKYSLPVDAAAIIRMPLGIPVKASRQTSGLRHALIEALPHLASEIDLVFSAAVFAGKPYERRLVDKFLADSDHSDKLYSAETNLISMTQKDPVPALWAMYRDRVDLDVFCWFFGNPEREYKVYSEKKRRKHFAASIKLDRWISQVKVPGKTLDIKQAKEAEAMEEPTLAIENLSLYGVIG
jgi:hypothetical protein